MRSRFVLRAHLANQESTADGAVLALAKADCIIVEEVATLSADLKAMAALPNDAARIVHRLARRPLIPHRF